MIAAKPAYGPASSFEELALAQMQTGRGLELQMSFCHSIRLSL